MFAQRRSHTTTVMVTLGGLLASVAAVAAVGANSASTDPPEALVVAAADAASDEPPSVEAPRGDAASMQPADAAEDGVASFARIGGLALRLPAEELVVLGFHESATHETVALEPTGTAVDHQNTTKFDPPPPDPDGTDYVVLSSRGRPMPATSAADLVLPDGVPVRAPVDGRVTDVREYYLYGEHLDHRIEIAPDDAPDLRVVMIHVDGSVVAPGDRVVAGETIVSAQVRRFPFSSHIDRYTEPDRFGHVHLEVKPAEARRPGDALEETAAPAPTG
ncbi:MAG: M23 family metallopeptidase [Ilumatobacteraceae bacterium]